MKFSTDPLEKIWDGLLSRDPARIRAVFVSLSPSDQSNIFAHLQRMATEDGWLMEQRKSAQFALETLKDDKS